MRRSYFVLLLGLVLAGIVLVRMVSKRFAPAEDMGSIVPSQLRVVDAQRLLAYRQLRLPSLVLRTAQDILPGGLAAAMAPLLVDWDNSELDRPDGRLFLWNLNAAGNPIAGITTLKAAVYSLAALESVEFVIVPLDNIGRRGLVSHAMLRFVFSDERPGRFLGPGMEILDEGPPLRDLILSWEAWRPPGVDFNVFTGLDPQSFALSLRAYDGPQRFLEDSLFGHDWYASPLRLPGGRAGARELLRVMLVLGDGAARKTIDRILRRADESWLTSAPPRAEGGKDARAVWDELRDSIASFQEPTDPRLDLQGESLGYQTLLRSCASLAFYAVNLAVQRELERGATPSVGMRPAEMPRLGATPDWMEEMAHADLAGLFARAPVVLRYVFEHPDTIPARIPGQLDRAGLVQHEEGHAVERHYSLHGVTPYGRLRDHLIR